MYFIVHTLHMVSVALDVLDKKVSHISKQILCHIINYNNQSEVIVH